MKSEEPIETMDEAKKPAHSPKRLGGNHLPWIIISAILLITVIILAILLYQNKKSSSAQKKESEQAQQELQGKVKKVEEELEAIKKDQGELKPTPAPTISFPANLKANLEAVLNTGNTQPIETYVTNPVTVILAASEAYGPVTPAKAASSMSYVTNAQQPWNCNLPAATLTAWQNGEYKQYFNGLATMACKSNDNIVIAFTVNIQGKITTIFMAANSDLL